MRSPIPLLFEHKDFIAVEKPYGFRTHRASETQLGLVEYCAHHRSEELWPVHRLDKGTSGVLIFARSKAAAQKFFDLFEQHQVAKEYLFLTTGTNASPLEVKSHIERIGTKFVSHSNKPSNAVTYLEKLSSAEFHPKQKISAQPDLLSIWSARPQTGKPHQIRLHAEQMGLSILGDDEHSGAPFFRLALHAHTISFIWNDEKIEIKSNPPLLFQTVLASAQSGLALARESSGYLTASVASELEQHLENIQPWINASATNAFLFKSLAGDIAEKNKKLFSAEMLGSAIWIKNYYKNWSEADWQELKTLAHKHEKSIFVRTMENRGKGVGGKEGDLLRSTAGSPETWIIRENQVQFIMKSSAGFSPGLFLDQSANRVWVKENSFDKSVLNLFSYTGGFSVNAAIGGAKLVTSVDVSANFLNWSKENFELNQVSANIHEFFKQDVLLFLTGAKKRNRNWDLIICDPPTFGRSQDRVWQLARDYAELIFLIWDCLAPNGQLLFTCNFEDWDQEKLMELTARTLKSTKIAFENFPIAPIDYLNRVGTEQSSYGFILRKLPN